VAQKIIKFSFMKKYLKILIPIIIIAGFVFLYFFWSKSITNEQINGPVNVTSSRTNSKVGFVSEFEGFVKNEFGNYIPDKTELKNNNSSQIADQNSSQAQNNSQNSNQNISQNSSQIANQNSTNSQNNSNSSQANLVSNSQNSSQNSQNQEKPKLPSIKEVAKLSNNPLLKVLSPQELPSIKLANADFVTTENGACGIRGLTNFASFENGFEARIIKNSQLSVEQNIHLQEFIDGQAGVFKNNLNITSFFKASCVENKLDLVSDLGVFDTKFGRTRVFVIRDVDIKYFSIVQVQGNWAMLIGRPLDNLQQNIILGSCGVVILLG
jgi:hypothetical protein